MDKKELYDMWEDSIGGVPANNASGGSIAGLPPDEPPFKKKKYDGRRKDVREFVRSLLKKRQKREEKKFKKISSLDEELRGKEGEEHLKDLHLSWVDVDKAVKKIINTKK